MEINQFYQINWVRRIFLAWLITMPFGAAIGAFSIGFMTIYPNLVLTCFLFIVVSPTIVKWNKILLSFFLLLGVWVIISAISPSFSEAAFDSHWKFDFRSLIMQFCYAGIIFGVYYRIGAAVFRKVLLQGIAFFLVVLIASGIFEFYSGIHLSGNFTDKLLDQTIVNNNFYSPVFIYDNPNDYLLYLIGLMALFLGLNKVERWKSVAFLLLAFVFAFTASSRIGLILCLLLLSIQFLFIAKAHLKKKQFKKFGFVTAGMASVFLIFLIQPVFIGPKYVKGEETTKGDYMAYPAPVFDGMSSSEIRKNLFLNGLDFVRESPIAGIGPGQFRHRHKTGSVKYDTGTVVGPHNYLVEVISQYGLIGWVYFLFLLLTFVKLLKETIRRKDFYEFCVLFPVFGLMSLMSSSFLYLNLNWFMVPILLLYSFVPNSIDKIVDVEG
ncbi:MAG: O-antigen ligase family protein [Crocinitomicaceae bacterium]|nr:O-antigen ligase family protein [Crocinitomicaceae bacterium]